MTLPDLAPPANGMPATRPCFVSVVVPLRNDSEIIEDFVTDVVAQLELSFSHHELVLVDDGSSDSTVSTIRSMLRQRHNIRLLCLSRRFGQETAISAGLDSVIGDFVVVMLPDIDPPAVLANMVDLSRDGAGIVYGIRRNRDDEPWWQRLGVRGFYWCCNTLLDLQIPNNVTHYRVFSRQAVNAVIQIRDHGRYLASLSAYVGFRAREFAYDPIQRRNTPRNKSLSESINLATEVIVSNSTKPLRLASRACILVAGVYAVQTIAWLPTDPSSGPALGPWTSILLVSTTMLVLAIVCEYLGRLYAESHARPLYYVQDELSSSVLESGASSLNVVEQSDVHLERAS